MRTIIERVPAKFPIVLTVVEHGTAKEKSIPENKPVTCIFCGDDFVINSDVAYTFKGHIDCDTPYVRCPKCNKRVCSVYYIDDAPLYTKRLSKSRNLAIEESDGEDNG